MPLSRLAVHASLPPSKIAPDTVRRHDHDGNIYLNTITIPIEGWAHKNLYKSSYYILYIQTFNTKSILSKYLCINFRYSCNKNDRDYWCG